MNLGRVPVVEDDRGTLEKLPMPDDRFVPRTLPIKISPVPPPIPPPETEVVFTPQIIKKDEDVKPLPQAQDDYKKTMGLFSVLGGVIGSIIEPGGGTAIGGALGGLLDSSGGSEGGSAGYDSYIKNAKRVGPFPDKTTLMNALRAAGVTDSGQLAAIQNTYDQSTGTATEGDWKMAVVSTAPIAVEWFKGANETFISRTTANLQVFNSNAAGGTPIAQSSIKAGAATNAVFPPTKLGGDTYSNSAGPYRAPSTPDSPGLPLWAWIAGGVVAFFTTIILIFSALKPRRR